VINSATSVKGQKVFDVTTTDNINACIQSFGTVHNKKKYCTFRPFHTADWRLHHISYDHHLHNRM